MGGQLIPNTPYGQKSIAASMEPSGLFKPGSWRVYTQRRDGWRGRQEKDVLFVRADGLLKNVPEKPFLKIASEVYSYKHIIYGVFATSLSQILPIYSLRTSRSDDTGMN